MVTVGLWAAQRGGKALWAIPLTFMGAMVGGGVLGFLGVQLPMVELGIAVSLMVLVVVVALSFRPPLWVGMVIVALFAVFHGHAHGTEIPEAASPTFHATGFLLATGVLHAVGVSFCTAAQRQGMFKTVSDYAVRSVGAIVAACGVAFALL